MKLVQRNLKVRVRLFQIDIFNPGTRSSFKSKVGCVVPMVI